MDSLSSAEGALGLAIAALLLVVGFRFAAPRRGREWAAAAAYAGALGVSFAGGSGLLGEPAAVACAPQRIAGGGVLVAGLLLAGGAARDRRLAARAAVPGGGSGPRLHAGLALVLLGYLLRAPSRAGAIATAAALLLHAWTALGAWGTRRR